MKTILTAHLSRLKQRFIAALLFVVLLSTLISLFIIFRKTMDRSGKSGHP